MENENTNPAEEKDKKPEQDAPPESAENAAEDAPEQAEENHIYCLLLSETSFSLRTLICWLSEKISVKSKTVIKTILPERL